MKKTALITGATGGIGEALCFAFAREGYNIIAHCFKNEDKCKKLCDEISSLYGIKALPLKADFNCTEEIKQLAEKALEFSDIDILINNAGISHQELFQWVSDEKEVEILQINTQSALTLTKLILPSMISRHNGSIINISSIWGVTGGSCEVHYSASKAALIGFTKALAKEAGPSGVRVNCIAPGLIDTKMNSIFSQEDLDAVIDETPLMRIGTGEDVAELALFLAGNKASFITGQIIGVDGGLSL